MNGDKKLIYFLVALIILFAIILLVKIKTTPKYDPKIYEEIYSEYEEIFGEENTEREDNRNSIQNIQIDSSITVKSNKEKGNVIGKILIPQVEIKCPIIKETTTEFLEVAPTKYCGPEVNEIRKFSCSRT